LLSAVGVPHIPQNFAAGFSGWLQLPHKLAIELPQPSQNLVPGRASTPH